MGKTLRWAYIFIFVTVSVFCAACAAAPATAVPTLPPTPSPTSAPSPTPTAMPTITPTPIPTLTPTLSPTPSLTPTPSPSPTPAPTPTKKPTPTPTPIPKDYTGICATLADYLADPANGQKVGDRTLALHGTWVNACVVTASEALRQVGCDIPRTTDYTTELIRALEKRGFVKSLNLNELQPGAICFTTDVDGTIGNDPTHAFIFLGWAEPGVMNIYDNQVTDYGGQYHTRIVSQHYLDDDPARGKDATAYFYYR